MAWDDNLFADYQWDFEGWTKDMVLKVERNTLRSLKTVLRNRGVYTGNNQARIADSLCSILGIEDPLAWDPVEFQAMDFDQRSKAYRRQQKHQRIDAPVDQPYQPKTSSSAGTRLLPQQHPQPESERKVSDNQQDELNGAGPNAQSQSKNLDLQQQVHQTKALPQLEHRNSPDRSISDQFITEVPVDSNRLSVSSVNRSDLPAHLKKDTVLKRVAPTVSVLMSSFTTRKPAISPKSSLSTTSATSAVHSYAPVQDGFTFVEEHTACNLDTNPIQLPPRPRPPGSSHIKCSAPRKDFQWITL